VGVDRDHAQDGELVERGSGDEHLAAVSPMHARIFDHRRIDVELDDERSPVVVAVDPSFHVLPDVDAGAP
jgi:hypothetical protein